MVFLFSSRLILVPGVIGVLQALETVKILLGHHGVLSKSMLLFDGSDCSFRKVRVRDRNPSCAVCGSEPTVTALIDYEQFCGSKANDKVIVWFGFFL
jgi:adenylyltransferase/sulfurtransferase